MGKALDITGMKFGKLTAIRKAVNPLKWVFQCECGIIKEISKKSVTRSNNTKSCGIPHFIDLSGRIFGNWTVMEYSGREAITKSKILHMWKCLCKCGKIKNVAGASLTRGKSNSCGDFECRTAFKDLTGQRFGKLVVLQSERKTIMGNIKTYWKCKCDCGNITVVYGGSLTCGDSRSCECSRNSKKEMSIKNQAWYAHIANCKKRGIENFLSKEQYLSISSEACHYCGGLHVRESGGKTNIKIGLNGIDRKDNELFYKLENSLPCCINCNRMKNDMSYEKTMSYLGQLFENIRLKK
jgi:hypothetical protein